MILLGKFKDFKQKLIGLINYKNTLLINKLKCFIIGIF